MKPILPVCLAATLAVASACAPLMVTGPTSVQGTSNIGMSGALPVSSGIKAAINSMVLASGEKRDLVSLLRTPEGQVWTQPLVWTSGDERVVSVETSTGRVTATGQGIAVVTASLQGDPTVRVGIEVSVVEKPTVLLIKVAPSTPIMAVGETLKLTPMVQMADGQINGNVSWSSSDDRVATVNPTTGELSAINEGWVTIVAAYAIDPRYKGLAEVQVVKDRAMIPPSPSPTPVVFAPGASPLPSVSPAEESQATPSSGTTGTLKGLVKNAETGAGEPGVTVKLSSGGSAVTDSGGSYTLSAPAGTATLTVSKSRFEAAENALTVSVAVGEVAEVGPISLKPVHWFNQISGVSKSLNAVYAIDEQRAWIVGDGGTLLRTTDGGASWVPAQSAPTANYTSVHFVNATTGWAVGAGGQIVKSTDGGKTWSSQASGMSADIQDVFFLNDMTGWAVTYFGVLSTADGGATWQKNAQAGGERVTALDAAHVVVAGYGQSYISTTGGLSWQEGGATSSNVAFLTVFSREEVWYGDSDGGVYRSDDGGLSFARVSQGAYRGGMAFKNPSTRELAFFSGNGMSSLNDLFFVTSQAGWAVGSGGEIKKY